MFQIEWLPQAKISILEIWLLADSSMLAPIREAINELERRLASAPLDEGEGRLGDNRVTFESHLGIGFSVDPVKKVVKIGRAWLVN